MSILKVPNHEVLQFYRTSVTIVNIRAVYPLVGYVSFTRYVFADITRGRSVTAFPSIENNMGIIQYGFALSGCIEI